MSILSDKEIKEKIKFDLLIEDSIDANIGPSFYELRMGDVYYDLTEDNKRIELKNGEDVIIKPGHLVVLITKEKINIPDDLLGRVVSKGSLFSIGLSPACTNADPGFQGNMGIVTQNSSNKYIKIPQGESIAKIDFNELTTKSERPYRGQHGYHTKIWPIKKQMQNEYAEVKDDGRIDEELLEAFKILPNSTSQVIKKLIKYQRFNTFCMISLIILNTGLIAALNQHWIETSTSFGISVLAGLFTLLVPHFSYKVLDK